MKRIVVLLFVLLLPLAASFAQASFLTPSGHDEEAEVPAADMPADPGSESAEWARNLFAGFVRDTDMCDDGTALFEDRLRQQAMKEHPEVK